MTRRRIHSLLIAIATVPCLLASAGHAQCTDETSTDCNDNGIPDACEIAGSVTMKSGPLGPVDADHPQQFAINPMYEALADMPITFTASGNLASWTQRIDVWLNDVPLQSIFLFATDCDPEATQTFLLSKDLYMDAVLSGQAVIDMVPSGAVAPGFCPDSYIDVSLDMLITPAADENHNGIPDDCELGGGTGGGGDDPCQGLEPTVYVDANGRIVGGPLDGHRYKGVLIGTPGDDVIRGTAGNDIIVRVKGDDVICGGGGEDRIVGKPEEQGQGAEHARNGKGRRK